MVNGVNYNDEVNNTQLKEQLGVNGVVTNPINNNPYKNTDKSLLIDETAISNEAINLYEKEQDIKQFTPLVTSDPEDLSHEEIIAGLFNKGISDPLSEDSAGELSNNERLLEDLGL